jgi:VanZ like family
MNELTHTRSRAGFYLHIVPAVLYVVAIFYGGLARDVPNFLFFLHERVIPQDKVMHFLGFGGMQIVLFRSLRFLKPDWSFVRKLAWAVVAASALGALLELVQMAVPYRDAEFFDWVADTLGALVAMGAVWVVFRRWGERDLDGRVSTAGADGSD